MRSIWSGSISFGLVNIPIKLYSAHTSNQDIDFDMLHKKDLSPVRYARICRHENIEIPWSEITKGVDTGGGNYVIIDTSEFEKALPRKTKTVDIMSFCDISEIDPIFLERTYYLESDKQSDKPYQLLLRALRSSGKVGIAKYVLRNKEHLAMLRPYHEILSLVQLRFDDEIADLSDIRFPMKTEISAEEEKLAKELVAQITKPFDATDYQDTFKEEMRQIIRSKIEGKQIIPKQDEPLPTEVNNLIETLSKSLSKK